MIRLNLMPHREQQRRQKKQSYQWLLMTLLALSAALTGCAFLLVQAQQDQQAKRNALLQRAHRRLDQNIERAQQLQQTITHLHSRLAQLEHLQQGRNDAVRLLTQLAHDTPPGVVLRQLMQDREQLSLHGYAERHEDIVRMLGALNQNSTLGVAQLRHTTQNGPGQAFIITMSAAHDVPEFTP